MYHLPSYSALASNWYISREIVFLNHGSFGACPIPVLEKQQEYRLRMERDPVHFMVSELEELIWNSRETLGSFVGAKAKDLIFVQNATTGVNTVLHNLKLKEGDEILTHDHIYGACLNALNDYAEQHQVKLVIANVPFPLKSPEEIISTFQKCITPRTRFALIDHVTSPTALVFPVKELTRMLQASNIQVLVDGAHAPGMIDLDLDELGAEYYTGNCHKWICSPKGSALLHVREDMQKNFNPLVISHRYDKPDKEQRWSSQMFWSGTGDFTPFLCVPDAIHFMNDLCGSWQTIRHMNHSLLLEGRRILLEKLSCAAPAPEELLGSIATIPLPIAYEKPAYGFNFINPLGQKLYSRYKIQVPVISWPENRPRNWIRISAQLYNSLEQFAYLAESLCTILEERFI